MSYWGVDSASPISESLLRRLPRKPDFWMRYLNKIQGFESGLTNEELTFASQNGLAVGLIWSGTLQVALHNIALAGAFAIDGTEAALRSLSLPDRKKPIAVFLDVEHDTNPLPSVIEDWCEKSSMFTPGLYYNHLVPSHAEAAKIVLDHRGLLWDCEPQYSAWNNQIITYEESETFPIGANVPGLRQYQLNQVGGLFDYDVCDEITYGFMIKPPTPSANWKQKLQQALMDAQIALDNL